MSLSRIASDLLNVEVNTVIAQGMTGRKMPSAGEALLDIAEKYHHFLDSLSLDQAPIHTPLAGRIFADYKTFRAIQRRVGLVQSHYGDRLDLEQRTLLARLDRNAGQLAILFFRSATGTTSRWQGKRRLDLITRTDMNRKNLGEQQSLQKKLDLSPDELILLRKIWEIGTERVLMQTVVQLDGDVVTRIQSGRETDSNRILHQVHRQSVDSALKHWQSLARTLAELVSSALSRFLPL